jgi:hypothetical protein
MSQNLNAKRRTSIRPGALAWLVFTFLAALFLLAYPVYVIRPFRYQGARELALALNVLQIRPYLQVGLSVFSVLLLVRCWGTRRPLPARILGSVLTLAVVGFAVLSNVNVYELMFNPLARPTFAAATKAKLDSKEQVIAIKVRKSARAYPIRDISYHHIVNDVVGGLPIVATY